MPSIFGRSVILTVTNKSGGSLAKGDVVIVDTANDESVTTTTSSGFTGTIGVVVEENGIANNATGRVQFSGYCALVTPNASVTRGNFGRTYSVAKQANDMGSTRGAGAFCQFLKSGTTPSAILFGMTDGSGTGLSDPMTTRGDVIIRNASNVTDRLGIGSSGKRIGSDGTDVSWGYPAAIGCTVSGTSTALSSGAYVSLAFASADTFDPFAFHDPASNNTRLTVPTGMGGQYRLTIRATWPSNASANTDRRLAYRIDGGTDVLLDRDTYSVTSLTISMTSVVDITIAAASYVEVRQWTGIGSTTTTDYGAGFFMTGV